MSDLPKDIPGEMEPVEPEPVEPDEAEEQPAIPMPPPATDNAQVEGGEAA